MLSTIFSIICAVVIAIFAIGASYINYESHKDRVDRKNNAGLKSLDRTEQNRTEQNRTSNVVCSACI